uniref:C3H1-type domain-containing protein n=1 Tax=Nicotiana tabacum TaxID=4097 RepID=A0A1S4ABL2_TOBAC|nr:PREDICTED: uncharacterized protein LOC107795809 [Nicotiana tabacum]
MRNIKNARFPKPMRSDPSQRDHNLWCEYDRTNGHRTGDCRYLHEEVVTLLKNGHLREFLSDLAKNNYGRNRDNTEPSNLGKVGQYHTMEGIGASQTYQKHHSSHKTPRRVQPRKRDNPMRDHAAQKCRGGDEDDPFRGCGW